MDSAEERQVKDYTEKELLRLYFHGLSDEQFEESINRYPLNLVIAPMKEYAQSQTNQTLDTLEERVEDLVGSHVAYVDKEEVLQLIQGLKESEE